MCLYKDCLLEIAFLALVHGVGPVRGRGCYEQLLMAKNIILK